MRQNGGGGIQPLVTDWAQIRIGGRTNTEPSLPRTACQRTFQGRHGPFVDTAKVENKFETSKTRVEGRKSQIDDVAYLWLALGFLKWYSTCL